LILIQNTSSKTDISSLLAQLRFRKENLVKLHQIIVDSYGRVASSRDERAFEFKFKYRFTIVTYRIPEVRKYYYVDKSLHPKFSFYQHLQSAIELKNE
jgi:hypothetical protein